MKGILKMLVASIMLLAGTGVAFSFNSMEQNAQKQMNEYLRNHGYDTRIKEDDHSVNFMVGDNIYWLTFKGDAAGILYTLHRRPIRLGEKDSSRAEINRLREKAVQAAALITAENPYKAYLKGNQVEFEFPVFAISASEYQKIFPKVLKAMKEINMKDFESKMKVATVTTDSIHNYWQNYAPDRIVIRQPVHTAELVQRPKGKVSISNPVVRSVDRNGATLIPYGEVMYQDRMQFIQPKVNIVADKPDNYRLSYKVLNPDGKMLAPSKDAVATVEFSSEVGKKEKELQFPSFGTPDNKSWKPGKYTIIFLVEDEEIGRQSVNIL